VGFNSARRLRRVEERTDRYYRRGRRWKKGVKIMGEESVKTVEREREDDGRRV